MSTKKYKQNLAAYLWYLKDNEGCDVENKARNFGHMPYGLPPMPHKYLVDMEKSAAMSSQILCSLLSFYKYLLTCSLPEPQDI